MAIESVWEDDVFGDVPLRKAVAERLPTGSRVIREESYGKSNWAITARVLTISAAGIPTPYFLKVVTQAHIIDARAFVEGEYHSSKDICAAAAGLVPEPLGWGEYQDGSETVYFLLSEFRDMDFDQEPDPIRFTSQLARVHRATSPNDKFGYHVPTAIGIMEKTVMWDDNWARFFTNQLKGVIEHDNKANGKWSELAAVCSQLTGTVVPRLLGALQSDGRTIMPALIHGDLWEENIGINKKSGGLVLFDPGCIYAHNEMEFGIWRCCWSRYFRKPGYLDMYHQHIRPSEPAKEWHDRNRLYCIYAYLVASANHPGTSGPRCHEIAYNDSLYLCEKYGRFDGMNKYNPLKDPTVTGERLDVSMQSRCLESL
ncbi:hypothetical protein PG996_014741 [Apiospora saccharicola]|uniref:protein-ribulosamine 3-kinase n=1 Tax=Apiospora saccharicola TaxID=335842 RepID=A0ABR1TJ92_9PEZI